VRLLVREVLVAPGKIVIRHSIPTRADGSAPGPASTDSDADAEPAPGSHLRWRSQDGPLGSLAVWPRCLWRGRGARGTIPTVWRPRAPTIGRCQRTREAPGR
jgi:hypothetical protein